MRTKSDPSEAETRQKIQTSRKSKCLAIAIRLIMTSSERMFLTKDSLTQLFRQLYENPDLLITTAIPTPLSGGILSHVLQYELTYARQSVNYPTQIIIKLGRKGEKDFHSYFQNEAKFYALAQEQQSFPFALAQSIFCCENFLILRPIPNIQSPASGCPISLQTRIFTKLAHLHAQFWCFKNDKYQFSSTAGIGTILDGRTKQICFQRTWTAFRENFSFQHSSRELAFKTWCQRLEHADLTQLHTLSISQPDIWTLIHGDFHFANILLPKDEEDDRIYLIDWAMSGPGNPLRDVVFFMIISCNWDELNPIEVLDGYYHELIAVSPQIQQVMSLEKCHQLFRACILNQFVLLVCYDTFTKDLISQSEKQKQPFLKQYFQQVNERCTRALLEHCSELDLPPQLSAEEYQHYLQQQPPAISLV